jgi:hypothetical protein
MQASVIEEYDDIADTWTMKLSNTQEGLEEAISILFRKLESKRSKIKINKSDIEKFISETYVFSDGSVVRADDARRACIAFFCIEGAEMQSQKFGRLMTDYITDRNVNIMHIERVVDRIGNGYRNIKLKSSTITQTDNVAETRSEDESGSDDNNMMRSMTLPNNTLVSGVKQINIKPKPGVPRPPQITVPILGKAKSDGTKNQ